jgi:hypothetical protein
MTTEQARWSATLGRLSLVAMVGAWCACHPRPARQSSNSGVLPSAIETGIESGVYGFSGAGAPDTEPEGVIGECVWIFDEHDHSQIARGECKEKAPGSFRVALKPGRYVVHGPGGNQSIEVKPGSWIKLESIASLPMAP